jgi:hypothetical protein
MPDIDDSAIVVPSLRFQEALQEELHWLEGAIVELIVRIASNPYDEAIVHLCQLRPPDDLETFVHRSPRGFEIYWDVELPGFHLPRTADMRIILTELRATAHTAASWLNHPVY